MKSLTKIYSFYLGRHSILKIWPLELQHFLISIYLPRWLFTHIPLLLTLWSLHTIFAQCLAPSMITANPVVTEVSRGSHSVSTCALSHKTRKLCLRSVSVLFWSH